jgi:phosphoglycerate dehydrogenase-like enzyme
MLKAIAVLDDFGAQAKAAVDWGGLPVTFFTDHLDDEDALAERLQPFEAVVLIRERTPFPASLIARLPKLRLVVATGLRNRTLDHEACRARGIPICGTHSVAGPTAELVWALILGLARRVPWEDKALREGQWQTGLGLALEGATLGVLGLGRIGSVVARRGTDFGMTVLAWSRNLTQGRAAECGAVRVDKDELFARADIVTVQLGLGQETRGIVGAREIGLMRRGALLVNTARAALVDEAALLAGLRSGQLGGAAIDVYDREPIPPDHPLLSAPNTILTPHLGYVTRQGYEGYLGGAIAAIRAFNAGEKLPLLRN